MPDKEAKPTPAPKKKRSRPKRKGKPKSKTQQKKALPRARAEYEKAKITDGPEPVNAVTVRFGDIVPEDAREFTLNEILDRVTRHEAKYVLLQMGSPIPPYADDLVSKLKLEGFHVAIHTDGMTPFNGLLQADKVVMIPQRNTFPNLHVANELRLVADEETSFTDLVFFSRVVKAERYILQTENGLSSEMAAQVALVNGAGGSWELVDAEG
jgi:organic radical activating enzyme